MSKTLIFDAACCVGCFACVVACMDQNDCVPENGDPSLRRVHRMTNEKDCAESYVSTGCRHCVPSPCLEACPAQAIFRDELTSAVLVDQDKCIGCRACSEACPFDIPRYDAAGKMRKCDLCNERLKAGLTPVCAKTCPFGALRYG